MPRPSRLLAIAVGALAAWLAFAVVTAVANQAVALSAPGPSVIDGSVLFVFAVAVIVSASGFAWHFRKDVIRAPSLSTRASTLSHTEQERAQHLAPPERSVSKDTPLDSDVAVAPPPYRYELPPTTLLAEAAQAPRAETDHANETERLADALRSYDVEARVLCSLEGPTVVTHDVELARGTRLAKVVALTEDLSLALGRKVRIAASGMGRLAFEIARERRAQVTLRELLEHDLFKTSSAALPIVLGACTRGEPQVADLGEMPHLLLAGATGSGKSVGLNAILASLLFARSPTQLRLYLVDPKQVELAPYDGVPHLGTPVIRDMQSAARALTSLVAEMERRYVLLADARCRGIASFNTRRNDPLPRIVVVIDELADLLACERKAVEPLLVRLAQKGRASGIHLVLATQRPSVDVVSPVLKASVPARISYRVASAVDSRVVLDEGGAEHLVGSGDALVRLPSDPSLRRIQAPWISEADVDALCNRLRDGTSSRSTPSRLLSASADLLAL